ncbi:hypothetical protein M747DRAFT_347526 [Aspergillus niger ATCC 13496]|uniref:Uncharacterized protein n=1 Tax=Aspergillus niger ATCC 13496 TaxID=1353008 RepID=A0A370BEE8_ASPNG|nr:hypothetical protein M747DRAFT_347526 [Aspergillus niger ATCC 13496]
MAYMLYGTCVCLSPVRSDAARAPDSLAGSRGGGGWCLPAHPSAPLTGGLGLLPGPEPERPSVTLPVPGQPITQSRRV